MIRLPSIVLIDDNKEDLESLQNSFNQAGYPCFPIHFASNDPKNTSGVDHVNLSMINPRVIITDLNLQELSIDNKVLVGPIVEVIKKLAINGPYLLYFWSKNASHVNGVMDLIFERYRNTIPLPLYCGVLDKAVFKGNPAALKDKVELLFSDNPVFNALFSWENRVSSAAQATTDSLFKLARSSDSANISDFQSKTTNSLGTLLAAIGNETIGVENAKEEPSLAIELGLEPVLHDHIQSSYERADNNSVWRHAASGIGTKLDRESYSSVKAYLNSFYHVEELNEDAPKNKRGSWVEFNPNYLGNRQNDSKIKKNLGKDIQTIINEEFINNTVKGFDENETFYSDIKLGFIELSAECDQAQRKTKLNRYLLSAMIPVKYKNYATYGKGRNTAHDGIYCLPNIIVGKQEYIIKISFMYQVGAIPDFNKWLGKPMFRLKDQILSDITFRASQHITRPGIIRFD